MKNRLYIPIILGTAREGRRSENVAKFVLQETTQAGLQSEIIDVRDYRLTATDKTKKLPQAKKLAEIVTKADGLIIVSPEYNRGYPGELKMMLDMLYEEYEKKPVGFCEVSTGLLGGSRLVEQLRLVSNGLRLVPIREAVLFSKVDKLFDDQGKILNDAYFKRMEVFLDELIWFAEALKLARGKKPT